jgi:endonuclease/exonuclease/phosphatase family metal-dependent hydrolase
MRRPTCPKALIPSLGLGLCFLALNLGPLKQARAEIVVMTQNVYVGANFDAVVGAMTTGNAAAISAAAATAYADMLATNFAERSAAIAEEIDQYRPALVGLQEVALYRSGPGGNPAPATTVDHDFLAILLNSLNARGLHYAAAVSQDLTDVEVTTVLGGISADSRLTDRNVILYNTDLTPVELSISNPQHSLFANNPVIPLPSGSLVLNEGWTSIDVQAGGTSFRFVNAHLVASAVPINILQGNELLAGPLNTSLPQLVLGDFNTRGDGTGITYNNLIAAGLQDAWSTVHPGDPGNTWGQAANLLNPISTFDKRIDFVMMRGGMSATEAYLVGEEQADRTPSGLWPSDHAGLVAVIVPEPSSIVLVGCGLAALAIGARRRMMRFAAALAFVRR